MERSDALRYNSVLDQIQRIKIDSLTWTVVRSRRRIETIVETLGERAEEAESLVKLLEEAEQILKENLEFYKDGFPGNAIFTLRDLGIVIFRIAELSAGEERKKRFEEGRRIFTSIARQLNLKNLPELYVSCQLNLVNVYRENTLMIMVTKFQKKMLNLG